MSEESKSEEDDETIKKRKQKRSLSLIKNIDGKVIRK